jgi:hypothetical protein
MLEVPGGTFAGNVTGRWSHNSAQVFYEFKLQIVTAVGNAAGWSGHHLVFWGYGPDGKCAGLRLHMPEALPPCTSVSS